MSTEGVTPEPVDLTLGPGDIERLVRPEFKKTLLESTDAEEVANFVREEVTP
jgi:hypothetical protein